MACAGLQERRGGCDRAARSIAWSPVITTLESRARVSDSGERAQWRSRMQGEAGANAGMQKCSGMDAQTAGGARADEIRADGGAKVERQRERKRRRRASGRELGGMERDGTSRS